nr:MAG TPA: hypothetical protein [Caudoviricetes sp.]
MSDDNQALGSVYMTQKQRMIIGTESSKERAHCHA